MICGACKSEVKAAKFCSSCGAELFSKASIHAAEFSLEWVAETLRADGYTVGPIIEQTPERHCIASKKGAPTLFIYYRPDIRLLMLQTSFSVRPPTPDERLDHLKAANSLNANSLLFKCWFEDEKYDLLHCQFGFNVPEVVSPLDLIAFNELTVVLVRSALGKPDALRFRAP